MQYTSVQEKSELKNRMNYLGRNGMFKEMKERVKNQRGLTLIELLAVIVVLGIVAAIAVPSIGNIIDNSKYNAVKADAINVINAAQLYYTDVPGGEKTTGTDAIDTTTSVTVAELVSMKYLDNQGKIPDEATITATSPHQLTASDITYAGSKKITFTNATIHDINENKEKGSANGDKTITAPSGS